MHYKKWNLPFQFFITLYALSFYSIVSAHAELNCEFNLIDRGVQLDLATGEAHFNLLLPNAQKVEIITEANQWKKPITLTPHTNGIWTGTIGNMKQGTAYKLRLIDAHRNEQYRIDPYAHYVVYNEQERIWNAHVWNDDAYVWHDQEWQAANSAERKKKMVIVEVHLDTFIPNRPWANIKEIVQEIVKRHRNKATDILFMPITHRNLPESWGYQVGALYSEDFRHGTPDDYKWAFDYLHQNHFGIHLDMVYGHSSKDHDTGLALIDGTEQFFKEGFMGWHPDWGTRQYDYSKPETRNYLLNNLRYWIEKYHIDGIRVDAVASMTDLSFSQPNYIPHPRDGGNLNHEAIELLRDMNILAKKLKPSFISVAEDSSGRWETSMPPEEGGLGFDFIWNMGGLKNMRKFLSSPIGSRDLHWLFLHIMSDEWGPHFFINQVNTHDEAAHLKKLIMMWLADVNEEERFHLMRTFYGYLFTATPGVPMYLQGDEFANQGWWNHLTAPKLELREYEPHLGVEREFEQLTHLRVTEPALAHLERKSAKLLLIDHPTQVAVSTRSDPKIADDKDTLVIVSHYHWRDEPHFIIPVPSDGEWEVIFDSDAREFAGKGQVIQVSKAFEHAIYGNQWAVQLNIPSYTTLILKKKIQ